MKSCTKCDAQNEDNVSFCTNCGNKFEVIEAKETEVTETEVTEMEVTEIMEIKEEPQQQGQPPPQPQLPQQEQVQQYQQQFQQQPVQPQPQLQPQQFQQAQQYQQPQQPMYQQPPPVQRYQQPPPQPQYAQAPYYQPQVTGGRRLSSNPAVNILKQAGSSPLFATIVIMYSITLVIRLVQVFLFTSNPFGQIMSVLSSTGLYDVIPGDIIDSMYDVIFTVNNVVIIINLIALIIPILIGVGMWMHYIASRNGSDDGLKLGGIKLIRVCTIINFIFMIIALAIALIAVIVGLVLVLSLGDTASYTFGGYFSDFDDIISGASMIFVIIISIYLVVLAGVIIFAIFYYTKLLKSIKAVILCAKTGEPKYKMSVFVVVLLFIQACSLVVTLLFGTLGTIISIGFYSGTVLIGLILSLLLSILNIVILISTAIAMIGYNSKISALNYQQNPPQFPVYQPQPQPQPLNPYNNQNPNRY